MGDLGKRSGGGDPGEVVPGRWSWGGGTGHAPALWNFLAPMLPLGSQTPQVESGISTYSVRGLGQVVTSIFPVVK